MQVIAVTNTKGGVGKSTLAFNLAVRAAQDGKRVAIVDLDPQQSLADLWGRRQAAKIDTDNPRIFADAETAAEAIEELQADGWDVVFIDSPPAFLEVVRDCIEVSDLALIPIKTTMVDLIATQEAVSLARESKANFLCVLNDVATRKNADRLEVSTRKTLFNADIPIAKTTIAHRVPFMAAFTDGKSVHELKGTTNKAAKEEIDDLWLEIKTVLTKAMRKGARND